MTPKRIALFGGSFDPPHNGHMLCINAVARSKLVDEIWVVPVGDDRFDKKTYASAEHRCAMVERMLSSSKIEIKTSINTLQLQGELKGSFTIDLVQELKRRHPENEYFFVVGADKLHEIPTWKSPDRLKVELSFLVIPRSGSVKESDLQSSDFRLNWVSLPSSTKVIDASSSDIRRRVDDGREIATLVKPEVAEYIENQKLYRGL